MPTFPDRVLHHDAAINATDLARRAFEARPTRPEAPADLARAARAAGMNESAATLCLDALEDALRKGRPEIFNTDQGAQFTSGGIYRQTGSRRGADQHGRPRALVGQRLCRAAVAQLEIRGGPFESLCQCSRGAQWHRPTIPLLQREPTAPGFDLQNSRRRCGRPRCALWICRCAWTTLAPRPQLHGSNNSITCCTSDEEEERTSPYQRTPVVLRLGSTAGCSRGEAHRLLSWAQTSLSRNPFEATGNLCL